MKFFVVYWHPEPKSFNHAMYESACTAIELAGHELQTSDLHSMNFDPISSRKNFKTTRDPDYLSLPLEEAHATIEMVSPTKLRRKSRKWNGAIL
jgi:NAD(P)H dehydrogenase (quinone)